MNSVVQSRGYNLLWLLTLLFWCTLQCDKVSQSSSTHRWNKGAASRGSHRHLRYRHRHLLASSSAFNASYTEAPISPPLNSTAATTARFSPSANRQLSVSHMARAAYGERGHGVDKGKATNHKKHSNHAKTGSGGGGGGSSLTKAAGGAWHSVKSHLGGGGGGGEKSSPWGGSPQSPSGVNNVAMGPGDEADRLLGHKWCLPDHLVSWGKLIL